MGDTSRDRSAERSHLPAASPPRNHGRTTAAWVTVTVIVVGATVSSIGVVAELPWVFWLGLGVILVGLVTGRVLKMFGLGQPAPSHSPHHR
ncbi:HGxxPAAW family protein [Cellulomonas sp. KRMCY2]|uniref:HGxxPAAW family protein n=1 Tax=Cellulomonas sp. KRMCY2 TaxID=1304865 RepID=UPI00045EC15C|nr:HGxxPAAW family protein [Cellulomonas sp. KRMCY2]